MILFTLAAVMSLVNGEKCGPVPGPLATTNDTVIINVDCQLSASSPDHTVITALHENVTHVAIKLVHCPTVPVGLFTNVTHQLTSVSVASQDALQLLGGTFYGLEHVTELRLLGFASLTNMSRLLFEPMRNIETLILDRFGRDYIKLSDLGKTIQRLSGSPIRELIITNIRSASKQIDDRILDMNDFSIKNASVQRLIVTGVLLSYKGSLRRAFPALISFCGVLDNRYNAETRPVMTDLIFLSDTLVNFTVYLSKDRESEPKLQNVSSLDKINSNVLSYAKYYFDFSMYLLSSSKSDDCLGGIRFKTGARLSGVTVNEIPIIGNIMHKPACFDETNKLKYLDVRGTPLPKDFQGIRGLKLLKYLSLESTGIETLPQNFTGYFPSLQVLRLGKLGIRKIIESADDAFFGMCPELRELYLDNCQLKSVPYAVFSRLFHLQHIDLSNNFLQKFDVDLQNSTELSFINLKGNNLQTIPQNGLSN